MPVKEPLRIWPSRTTGAGVGDPAACMDRSPGLPWFIHRFSDAQARLPWLRNSKDWPVGAIGFDFDGARFSHVGAWMTFEVMVTSFGHDKGAQNRIGALVHFIDVEGVRPPEAAGVLAAPAGVRDVVQATINCCRRRGRCSKACWPLSRKNG
ncbi:MAG: Chromate resistance exported protein [Variovorax sp.]|jgi:hypothetical protein|nr:Chromate resistance exported protein [Variovorax sp.]